MLDFSRSTHPRFSVSVEIPEDVLAAVAAAAISSPPAQAEPQATAAVVQPPAAPVAKPDADVPKPAAVVEPPKPVTRPQTDERGLQHSNEFPEEKPPSAVPKPEHPTDINAAGLRQMAPRVTPAAPPPQVAVSAPAPTAPAAPAVSASASGPKAPRQRTKRGPPPEQIHITRDLPDVCLKTSGCICG